MTRNCTTRKRPASTLQTSTPDVHALRQVVTECVANAVEHTDAATVGASITRTGKESARIVVTDTSRTRPAAGA